MPEKQIRVFGDKGPVLTVNSEDWQAIAGRTIASVGADHFDGPRVSLGPPEEIIELLDGWLTLSPEFEAGLSVHARKPVRDLYGEGSITEPANGRFVEFEAKLELEASASGTVTPWGLSIKGGLDSGLSYRHLLAVTGAEPLARAYRKCVESSILPNMLELRELDSDEHHELSGSMGLRMEIAKKLEAIIKIDKELVEVFDGLSVRIQGQVQGAVRAALGLSFQGNMRLVIGREEDDWVRIRLQRAHERTFTFGSMISLQATYDLASSLESVLEHALGLLPMPQIVDAMKDVDKWLGDPPNWKTLRENLSAEATERIGDLLDEADWLDQIEDNQKLQTVFKKVQAAVSKYRELDDKVQSWWDHMLISSGFTQMAEIRRVLGLLKNIDPNTTEIVDLLTDATGQDAGKLLELIELVSGKSVDELLAGLNDIKPVLTRVQQFGEQALGYLDLDDEVLEKLHQFTKKSGIDSIADWLEKNAASVESLKKRATVKIQDFVESVLGKALDQVDSSDLDRLFGFVARLKSLLAKKDEWEKKLRNTIATLKGEFGFSIAIEFGRLASEMALIDLSISAKEKKLLRAVEKIMGRFNVRELLEALPKDDPDEDPVFLVNECVFASRRERWATGSFLFGSLFGSTERRQVIESTVRISGPQGDLSREASVGGGLIVKQTGSLADPYLSSAFLEYHAEDNHADPDAHFTGSVKRSLRLACARSDAKIWEKEVETIQLILDELGFQPLAAVPQVPDQAIARWSMWVRLPEEGAAAVLKAARGVKRWNEGYYNACYRWFQRGLAEGDIEYHGKLHNSDVLQLMLADSTIRQNWTSSGTDQLNAWARGLSLNLPENGSTFPVPLTPHRERPNIEAAWDPHFFALLRMIQQRPWGHGKLKKLGKTKPLQAKGVDQFFESCDRFARMLNASHPRRWRDPMFGFWLMLSLVKQAQPNALTQASGMAILRWKVSEEADWEEPIQWMLPTGQGIQLGTDASGKAVFPF